MNDETETKNKKDLFENKWFCLFTCALFSLLLILDIFFYMEDPSSFIDQGDWLRIILWAGILIYCLKKYYLALTKNIET